MNLIPRWWGIGVGGNNDEQKNAGGNPDGIAKSHGYDCQLGQMAPISLGCSPNRHPGETFLGRAGGFRALPAPLAGANH